MELVKALPESDGTVQGQVWSWISKTLTCSFGVTLLFLALQMAASFIESTWTFDMQRGVVSGGTGQVLREVG